MYSIPVLSLWWIDGVTSRDRSRDGRHWSYVRTDDNGNSWKSECSIQYEKDKFGEGPKIRAVKFNFDANIYGDESDIIVDNIEITNGCSAADIVLVPTFNCNFENGEKYGAIDDEGGDFT